MSEERTVPNYEVLEEGLYFAPVGFGIAGTGNAEMAEFNAAMADKAGEFEGTAFGALLQASGQQSLADAWPPEPAYRFKLKAVARAIHQAAKKVGVAVHPQVILTGGDAMQMSVTPDGQLLLDWESIKNERLNFGELEALLLKQFYKKKHGAMKITEHTYQALSLLGPLKQIVKFYEEDPQRVQQQIEDEYGSVDAFREKVGKIYTTLRPFLSHAAMLPGYGSLRGIDILQHEQRDGEAYAALKRPIDLSPEVLETVMYFGMTFMSQYMEMNRANLKRLGGDTSPMLQEVMDEMGATHFDKPRRPVSDEGAEALKRVMDDFLRPAIEHESKLQQLFYATVEATELRADRAAVAYAANPHALGDVYKRLPVLMEEKEATQHPALLAIAREALAHLPQPSMPHEKRTQRAAAMGGAAEQMRQLEETITPEQIMQNLASLDARDLGRTGRIIE